MHEMLSGILGSVQTDNICYTENLVVMTNSRQVDVTSLNGFRVTLPLLITNEVGFMVTSICYLHAHDMIPPNRTTGFPHQTN